MKRIDINILDSLGKRASTVGELSRRVGFSVSYVSERIKVLESKSFLSKEIEGKRKRISLKDSFSIPLKKLRDKFALEMLFSGKKDSLLLHLLKPHAVREIEKETNLSQAQIYKDLRGLKQIGAVRESKGKYFVNQEIKELVRMMEVLKDKELYREVEEGAIVLWRKDKEILKKVPHGSKVSGVKTAFSKFSGNNLAYLPVNEYFYQPPKKLSLEEIFVHSLVVAETKTQLAICTLFFLLNKEKMDGKKLKELSRKFSVFNLYLDMLSYLQTRKSGKFLPWNEFMEKAKLYGIQLKKFDDNSLLATLRLIGKNLDNELDIYLIGGLNLMLRKIKDSTKDIDIILKKKSDLKEIKKALRKIGYKEETRAMESYKGLHPSAVMKKNNSPNFDLFVKVVCGGISFSKEMESRAQLFQKFNKLRLNLLSPEAIFIFKSITEREGDLEDAKALALKYPLNWNKILSEIKRQESSGKTFSFALLDTLEILEERWGISPPILKKLRFHCLKNGLLLALEKPRTIKELKKWVDFPRYMMEKALSDLENEGKVKINKNKKPYKILRKR